MDREYIENQFARYTAGYDLTNPKIGVKIAHTLRVAQMADRIAQDIGADRDLAWLCGMLHDIGRFEQIKRYDTFVDAISVDHAKLSCELLFEDRLIRNFAPESEQTKTLETAIRYHSFYRLPDGLTEEERLYSQILRDADKLDIFRAICETPLTELYGFSWNELREADISDAVKTCFENRTAVLKALWQTPADIWVAHICLYFELVYPVSQKIAHEQGYIDRLLDLEFTNVNTREWFEKEKKMI